MHVHPHRHSSAAPSRSDREGRPHADASPSGGTERRWIPTLGPLRIRTSALKPVTYSLMRLIVAITVAYALTRDWRIALGVGLIEPMVQTLAYMSHQKVWSFASRQG